MKDYKIVWEHGKKVSEVIEKLEKAVQTALENGWEPQGGVYITESEYLSGDWYRAFQAMTKNE